MKIEIEVTDIERDVLCQWRKGKNAYPRNILDKVYDALPRPIQVGDTVRFNRGNSYVYVVMAIVKRGVLLRATPHEQDPFWNASDISELVLVSDAS